MRFIDVSIAFHLRLAYPSCENVLQFEEDYIFSVYFSILGDVR